MKDWQEQLPEQSKRVLENKLPSNKLGLKGVLYILQLYIIGGIGLWLLHQGEIRTGLLFLKAESIILAVIIIYLLLKD